MTTGHTPSSPATAISSRGDRPASETRPAKGRPGSKRKIAFAFGSAISILLAVGTFSYRSIVDSNESDRWVRHTDEVLDQLQEMRIDMETISSSVRGFVLTGSDSYLEAYHVVTSEIERHTSALRELTADNPTQQGRLPALERLADERHGNAERAIELRRAQGLEATIDEIRSGSGQRIRSEFQERVREMQDEEHRLLALRVAGATESARRTKIILILGTILGLVITVVSCLSVLGDNSKRQRAETELRAVNQELEEFAYIASHDLKAPLRVIDNASKWLEEDLEEHLTSENLENMNLLRGRVARMEKLLDDLLEYSRIGRTTDKRQVESIMGNVLMDNILALLSPPAGFIVKVSPAFANIRVCRLPLQQILMNHVSNAIKHHDKKTGCIEVTVEDRGADYAFAVKDDGPGIRAQFHEQVFKMFQTLRPRDQVEGSGMGLAMVRRNITVFGGTLDLESAEGSGSVFRFTWPKHQKIREQHA